MSHRLDQVAVGIDDEGGVVLRVILGPETRLAVVASPGSERRRVEAINRGAEGRAEADVAVERGAIGVVRDPKRQGLLLERMRLAAAVAGSVLDVEHAAIAKRRQDRIVEGTAPREVANADRDVVDHRPNGLPPP